MFRCHGDLILDKYEHWMVYTYTQQMNMSISDISDLRKSDKDCSEWCLRSDLNISSICFGCIHPCTSGCPCVIESPKNSVNIKSDLLTSNLKR